MRLPRRHAPGQLINLESFFRRANRAEMQQQRKRKREATAGTYGVYAGPWKSVRLSPPRRDAVNRALDVPAYYGTTPTTPSPPLSSPEPTSAQLSPTDVPISSEKDTSPSPAASATTKQESKGFWSCVATIPETAKGYDPLFPEFPQKSAGLVMPGRKERARRSWKKRPEVKEAEMKAGEEAGPAGWKTPTPEPEMARELKSL